MGIFDWLFGLKEISLNPTPEKKKTVVKETIKKPAAKKPAVKSKKDKPESTLDKKEDLKKVSYSQVEDKNDIIYFNKEKYTGIVIYGGNAEAEYEDGVQIVSKHYFDDGDLKSISEPYNGEEIELKGWIKIDKNGEYDENGKKILVREFKDGKKIEYYKNGNIKSEKDANTTKSVSDSNDTFTEISYFENGNIRLKEVFTKYDANGNNGGEHVEDNCYYETGEVKKEKVEDEKYPTKYISYFKDKSVQSICVSNTRYEYEGHTFEFDKNGNEISKIDLNSDEEQKARKYLKLKTGTSQEVSKAKEKAGKIGKKVIELKIDDIKIKTTLGKFEEVINGDNGYVVDDYDDDYNLFFNDSADEVYCFLDEITDEKLVITAEYYANDEKLGEIKIEEVFYLNCECPEKLKKYYNGDIFISYRGEKLDRKSDSYKKIDFDNIWEDAEITNSGVVIEKFND